jgi:hypothetical protein
VIRAIKFIWTFGGGFLCSVFKKRNSLFYLAFFEIRKKANSIVLQRKQKQEKETEFVKKVKNVKKFFI